MKKTCTVKITETYEINQKFCDYFTSDELKVIIKNCNYIFKDVIIFSNDNYFIELSADIYPDKLDIYVENKDTNEIVSISKEKLMEIFINENHNEMLQVNIDE